MIYSIRNSKILIVGRVAWTVDESTLPGIFSGFAPEQLAYLCIETRKPDFGRCHRHFQISEVAMIRRLLHWGTPTGADLTEENNIFNTQNEQQEKAVLSQVRAHRSFALLFMRELLWRIGHWKSKEMEQFIIDFQPDVVFCVGDPLPLMNRLQRYVVEKSGKPGILFMMDDIWSYKACHGAVHHLYRWMLRRQVSPLVKMCKTHFAISPKMKREYDEEFGINCEILTKGINPLSDTSFSNVLHNPITLVYTGNLLYGRLSTLSVIADAIEQLNAKYGYSKAMMHIYTQTQLNNEDAQKLNIEGASEVHKPVPYDELSRIYTQSDIVLFVESLEDRYKNIARLSFSTKLTDYMGSGKCIFAVGAEDVAPIEYLREAGIAAVCTSEEAIPQRLTSLLENSEEIVTLGKKAYEYGQLHHSAQNMNNKLNMIVNKLSDLPIS